MAKKKKVKTLGVRVTAKVIKYAGSDKSKRSVTLVGEWGPNGTYAFAIEGTRFTIVKGDTHAAWPKHQGTRLKSFNELYEILEKKPDKAVDVLHLVSLP